MAAATQLTLGDPRKAQKEAGRRAEWQEDAWAFFDGIPEVKFSMWYMGNGLAKLRLFVGVLSEDEDAEPIPIDAEESGIDAGLAAICRDELSRLGLSVGGQGEILRELNINLEVAGECYLVGRGARDEVLDPISGEVRRAATPESWEIRSVDEVSIDANGTRVRSSPGEQGELLDPELDDAIRIYQRHPRWSGLADCHMRGALDDCEALMILSAQQKAESRSRHNAGILTLPNELSTGPQRRRKGGTDEGTPEADPLSTSMVAALTLPTDDPSAAGAVAPTMLRGPASALKPDVLRWIDIGRRSDESLEKRIEQRTQRLARGLNLPVEKVMGHQQTTYANAEQVDQDEFEDFHRPRAVLIVNALTVAFLHPNVVARGIDPAQLERVVVWFDASGLISEPDPAEPANDAWDRRLLSNEAYRKRKGITEDEAPTDEEVLGRTGLSRGIFTADLSLALLKMLGVEIDVVPIPPAVDPNQDGGSSGDASAQNAVDGGGGDQASGTAASAARALLASSLVARVPEDRRAAALDAVLRFPDRHLAQLALTAAAHRAPLVATSRPAWGRQLMELDRDLRSRLLIAADRAMDKALERAGNRLRGRQARIRNLTRHVSAAEVAATVGPELLADAGIDPGDLLDGAWDDLRDNFVAWGADSQRRALNIVNEVVGGFDTATRRALGLRQAQDLEQAADWLVDTLTSLAHGRLFDPNPLAEALGEVASGVSIPPGLVRRAVSQAGGAAALTTDGEGSAWVTLTDGATRPAGGIGTGDLMRETLRDHGASIEAYEWAYGPGARKSPFEPHVDLDGVVFETFDDPVLAISGSFPDGAFYMPGDHSGCQCDFEPIILAPDGSTTPDVGG